MLSPSAAILLFLLTLHVAISQGYPWDPDFILSRHLASKTAYYPLEDISQHLPPPATCTPVHFDLISRHGTRNPGDDDILEYIRIEQEVQHLKGRLVYKFMENFKNPIPLEDEGKLVLKGQLEQYELAKRYIKAYPEIWTQPYNSDIYFMRATQEQRAMMSGDTFAYSLLERKGKVGPDFYEPHFILSDSESQDLILKYYDNCQLYKDLVDENETANLETEFYLAKILPGIASRLTKAITTDQSWNITGNDVLAFHSICQTQVSILDIENEFCTLFLQSELEALEYWEDLDDYYTKAYPYSINYKMVVPLLQDVVQSMKDVIDGSSRQKANLRHAHSSTVVPLIAAFGLYKDSTILSSNSPQNVIDNRLYRTSVVSPMGSNWAFTLYRCSEGAQYRVKILQNEKETVVQGCSTLYCPFEEFTAAYRWYLENNFNEVCKN